MEEPYHASQTQAEYPALTATGEHPSQPDSRACSPAGDEPPPVSSTFATAEIPPGLLDHDKVDSLQGDEEMTAHDYGYNSSASSGGQSSSDILARDLGDGKLAQGNSRSSSHSSVSSIPDSVLIHSSDALKSLVTNEPHHHAFHRHDQLQLSYNWNDHESNDSGKAESPSKSVHTIRQREGAFRKPSSVRAMQMHTEDEGDDEILTPPRRRGGQRHSDISMRSSGSSPLKRLPYHSPSGSASKQRVKKEYPLVLLHCTLLPPSLPVVGITGAPNQNILKEVLPREYWRRWKLLEEKVGSGVLRDRGVLISHPEDTYDLLEERLLESLELQRPRLQHGHFLGHEENDSEKEEDSSKEESATDDEQGEECPDCGGRVVTRSNQGRKWEIKVFAANGLMRAGAWAAAWKEMEKIDVEVGLWLPSEVRRQLERRLLEDEMTMSNHEHHMPSLNESSNEVVTPSHPRAHTRRRSLNGTAIDFTIPPGRHSSPAPAKTPQGHGNQDSSVHSGKPTQDIDLQTLLVNYIRVLANDRRNIAISILSIVVVFIAIGSVRPATSVSELRPFPQDMFDSVPSSAVSMSQNPSVNMQNTAHFLAASPDHSDISSSLPTSVVTWSHVSAADEPNTAISQPSHSEVPTVASEPDPVSISTATMSPDSSIEMEIANSAVPIPEDSEGPGQSENTTTTVELSEEPSASLQDSDLEPASSAAEPTESGSEPPGDPTHIDENTVLPPIEPGKKEETRMVAELAESDEAGPGTFGPLEGDA